MQKSGDALNDIGLSVSESKQLLGAVQKSLVQQQADEYIHQNIRCPHCLTKRRIKGQQKIQYRTLFGVIPVSGGSLDIENYCTLRLFFDLIDLN